MVEKMQKGNKTCVQYVKYLAKNGDKMRTKTLEDLLVKYEHPIVIICDNTSAINMSKNPIIHSKTKHIQIKYHYLREQVSQKAIKLEYIDTKEHVADIFTKPLPKEAFEHLRQKMGVFLLQNY